MGADIYLHSEHDRCRNEWEPKFKAAVAKRDQCISGTDLEKQFQAEVDDAYSQMYSAGYFRDCYNSYGFFAQTELSWWRDVVPMLDSDGNLPIDKARELRDLVAKVKIDPKSARKIAGKQKDKAPAGGWKKYYEKDRSDLLALLDKSIELNEPLDCSL